MSKNISQNVSGSGRSRRQANDTLRRETSKLLTTLGVQKNEMTPQNTLYEIAYEVQGKDGSKMNLTVPSTEGWDAAEKSAKERAQSGDKRNVTNYTVTVTYEVSKKEHKVLSNGPTSRETRPYDSRRSLPPALQRR